MTSKWLAFALLPLLVGATTSHDRSRGAPAQPSRERSFMDALVNHAGQHAAEAGLVRESEQMAAVFDDAVFSKLKGSETVLDEIAPKRSVRDGKLPHAAVGPKTHQEAKAIDAKAKELKRMLEEEEKRKAHAAKEAKAFAARQAKEAAFAKGGKLNPLKVAAKLSSLPLKDQLLERERIIKSGYQDSLMVRNLQLTRFMPHAPEAAPPGQPKVKKGPQIDDIFGQGPSEIFLPQRGDPVPLPKAKKLPPPAVAKGPSTAPVHVTHITAAPPAANDPSPYSWWKVGMATPVVPNPPPKEPAPAVPSVVESVVTSAPALQLKPKAHLPPVVETPPAPPLEPLPEVILPARTVTVDVARRPAVDGHLLPSMACNVAFPELYAPRTHEFTHDAAPHQPSAMCQVVVDCAQSRRRAAARRLMAGGGAELGPWDEVTGHGGSGASRQGIVEAWGEGGGPGDLRAYGHSTRLSHTRSLLQEVLEEEGGRTAHTRGASHGSTLRQHVYRLTHPTMNVVRNVVRHLAGTRESSCEGSARACGPLGTKVGLHLHEHSLGSCAVVAPTMADEARHQVAPGAYARSAALIDGHNTVIRMEGPAARTRGREWLVGAHTNVLMTHTHLGDDGAENVSSSLAPDYFYINEAGGSDRAPVGHHEGLPYVTLQALTLSTAATELYEMLASHVIAGSGAPPISKASPSAVLKLVVALLHSRLCTRLSVFGGMPEMEEGELNGPHYVDVLEQYVFELAAANRMLCYNP
eukprot:jgi/Mesvir1/2914/Mv13984-RA.1